MYKRQLLDSFGELHVHEMKQRGIDEQGIRINLHVRMTEGKWPEEYELSVCVKPPVLTEQEQTEAAFAEFLKKEDELQSTTAYMKLPKAVSYTHLKQEHLMYFFLSHL